ncbi:MAG: YihY/virulence factor BrkB family protein [candidate division NC10 bacterium]|nr:YihY/virulence factor BrkB family protein [candidate division NC10 bacterium]
MASRRGWLRRVSGEIVRRLREHDLMMMAAAIAFYWLLALIPLLLLGTSAIGYLLGSSDRAVDEVMTAARRMIPRATGRDVEAFLRTLIQSRHVTGGLGIAFLVWVSMGVFEIIGASLTALTGGRETRSYLRRKLVALVLMCTAGFLLLLTLMGGWILAAWPNIEDLAGMRLRLPAFLTDPNFPRYFTSVLMGILLTIVYRVAPVRDIRWPAAIAGATVAAILWHQAKVVFNWYLTHYARYNLFYGILGGFIGLVLWIFYAAIILLFGGMLADILDRGGHTQKPRD